MFKFWKRKQPTITPEAQVFESFGTIPSYTTRRDIVERLIKMYIKDYHLHKSPPKGRKKKVAV